MRVSHQHRIALAGIAAKNAKVHYVCDQLGHPETPEVIAWLRECDADIDPKYVSRIVRSWRKARGLLDTGEMAALTEEVLTELDAQQQHQEDEATVSEIAAPPIEPPAPEVTEPDSVQELAARVREAQGLLPLQADQALLTVLSEDELAAERALAEWERATDREIRRAAKAAELARVKREQATAETIAKSEAADARWHQRALSARRKLTSPHARLAQLYRRAEWSSRALIAIVLIGMVWSAVNVQRNLVPSGDMSNPLYWISYGIEAMISVPLIVIMIAATTAARWGRELPRGKVIPVELALLAITVGLNAGPHFNGKLSTLAEYSIAPVMVGIVIWLHAWVSAHYATLITGSDEAALSEPSAADLALAGR